TSAIMNPLRPQEMEAVRAANVLMSTDANCMTWIKTYREPVAEGGDDGDRRGRREGRRRRA
ncbi:MAG: methyltetrahydrofolate cobalamin methyltransferase, partial [Hyphomicrobiales bacterium]|nr:methyltetrahydrofolate cobalamin methyltransferase [Hyphomicrobiales bacterium]